MSRNWTTRELADALHRQGMPMDAAIRQACGDGKNGPPEVPNRSKSPNRSKYNVGQDAESRAKRTVDGILFASYRESVHYRNLKIAQDAGAITVLKLQPRFLLQEKFTDAQGKKHRAIYYKADFGFMRNDAPVVVDSKGFLTEAFKIKWKLVVAKYPLIKFETWK